MSEDSNPYGTQRRRWIQAMAAGGAALASTHTLASGTDGTAPNAAMQQHHEANHYHKFLVGPLEVDVNINDTTRVAQVSLHPFFSSHMAFVELTLSEAKGILDIKRGFHLPELNWGGEMECGVDFDQRRFATHIELDTPLGAFKKGPVLHWS